MEIKYANKFIKNQEEEESLTTDIDSKIDKEVKYLVSKEDLANTKTEMIKWFVWLFFALALMVIGLYFQ